MNTDDRKWEIIESEYLIRRPWLTARRDRVKLPLSSTYKCNFLGADNKQ